MSIDITALSRVIRWIDISATLRAFVAVLAPLFVLNNLRAILQMVRLIGSEEFSLEDHWHIIGMLGVFALLAFAPLAFIFMDWVARQDKWRHLAAFSGAAWGALGFLIISGLLILAGYGLEEIEFEFHGIGPRQAVIIVGLGVILFLTLWLLIESKLLRTILLVLAASVGVLILTGIIVAMFLAYREGVRGRGFAAMDAEEGNELGSALMSLLALVLGSWWLFHAVRTRIVMSRDRPRSLLLGDLHPGGFWRRLAFLVGLPSSLWNLRALRSGAFWAFIASRPLVYVGFVILIGSTGLTWGPGWNIGLALLIIGLGHFAFYFGKRLAARKIWDVSGHRDPRSPVLFLRSFNDDQFKFKRSKWNFVGRWLDLWSFRHNADEALVDEIAQYGPVIALGKPGETRIPFGAARRYCTHDQWMATVTDFARSAQAIVIVAGDTPGVLWEYELLAKEKLIDRTLLLFRPAPEEDPTNRRALNAFLQTTATVVGQESGTGRNLVAFSQSSGAPALLTSDKVTCAAYIVALRAHFQRCLAKELADPAF